MKPANNAPTYLALYPQLAEIARKHGYAMAVHGSVGRDFDLICIPWVDEPSEPDAVIDEIVSTFVIHRHHEGWVDKKHGRRAHTLYIFGEWAIDLSFMPAIGENRKEWLGPCKDAWTALNETRKAVAEIIGANPETWPAHGNAPLAIAASVAVAYQKGKEDAGR